jgi:hypothetical protein
MESMRLNITWKHDVKHMEAVNDVKHMAAVNDVKHMESIMT